MEDIKKTYVQQIKDYIAENGSITMKEIQVELGICSSYARMHDLKNELDKTDDLCLASISVKRKGKSPYKRYFIKNIAEEKEEIFTPEDYYDMVGCNRYEER